MGLNFNSSPHSQLDVFKENCYSISHHRLKLAVRQLTDSHLPSWYVNKVIENDIIWFDFSQASSLKADLLIFKKKKMLFRLLLKFFVTYYTKLFVWDIVQAIESSYKTPYHFLVLRRPYIANI